MAIRSAHAEDWRTGASFARAFRIWQSRTDLVAAAQALCDANISEIAFYNYGHLRRGNLAWIRDALVVFGD